MTDYFRGKTLTCEQTKPRTYFTPVFQRIGDRLKLHHMEVDCLIYQQPKKMLPIEHMGKHKRRIFELEDENAKLRELCFGLAKVVKNDDDTFRRLREIAKQELSYDFIGMYDSSLGKIDQIARFIDSMAELGIEVD